MTTHYYQHCGCGGGCLLGLIMLLIWPLLMMIRLFGGKPVTFGGDLRDRVTPPPGGGNGSEDDGTVIDVEAKEVPPETKNLK
ncbi:hypothetical protein SDC9_144273 [bioreactor metagenome]|uniref:Uncharacterized protein n=1 Tax=bioreactor metagenome TaxID=1076179 RepID=A0A645E5N0_9ZZZZ|nr:hypothetical protein [Victivallaceae bacterium]